LISKKEEAVIIDVTKKAKERLKKTEGIYS
jgi:hypothetical protein